MPEPLAPALARLRAELLAPERMRRAVASGRRRASPPPPWRRTELRWVDLRAGRRLSVVRYDERQAHTTTVPPGDEAATVDEVLAMPYGSWHVDLVDGTVSLRVTKRGDAQVHSAARSALPPADLLPHDRVKPTLLDPGHPVLHALGLTTPDGTVRRGSHDKLRQVEQMLRAVQPVLPELRRAAAGGPLRAVDLGCGNATLTFAAQAWLQDALGTDVRLLGVDVRPQARERNEAIAASLGWADRTRFLAATIADADVPTPVHLVLALHACDTATDDALARAVGWQAPVVLAAPCCHHDLQRQLRDGAAAGRPPPDGWAAVARHGILRERLADVLTDALRAAVLRRHGYRVDVLEFVESRHTPRNVLLRAVRTGAPQAAEQRAQYGALTAAWGVVPALASRLGDGGDDTVTERSPFG